MEIHLTDAGKAAAEAEPEGDPQDAMFEVLSAEEQASFSQILQKLIDHLEAQPGPEEGDFGPRGGFGHRGGFGPPEGFGGPHHRGRRPE